MAGRAAPNDLVPRSRSMLSRPSEPAVNDVLRAEYAARGEAVDTIRIGGTAAAHVRAYLEYDRIVGDADGGKLLSEAEYAAFVARATELRRDRIYITWRCTETGMDCKNAGPSTKCFCGHMLKQHTTDNVMKQQAHAKDVHCKSAGCSCPLFEYMPGHGTWSIKCTCKHEATEHDPRTKRCRTAKSCGCAGYFSSFSCSCGRPWAAHVTSFETREERESAGRPVDNLGGGGAAYEALGGITDMSSLVDGADRVAQSLPFTQALGRLQRGQSLGGLRPQLEIAGSAAAAGGGGGGAGPSRPSPAPTKPPSAAAAYALAKREAMERAAHIRAEREAASRAADGQLSELEQLHRASFRKR